MRYFSKCVAIIATTTLFSFQALAQKLEDYSKIEMISHGDMDSWRVRQVDESVVIGGETKFTYEIAKGDTIKGNTPYVRDTEGGSPWATSSVMAKVSGVVKSSTTIFPERRGNGYAAKCEVKLETCKVLGLFNIRVLASGTVFLGGMNEPIKDTKDPMSKLICGIPFAQRPDALILDVNYHNEKQMYKATGFGKPEAIAGESMAECTIYLQQRWEDSAGNIYARRIATGLLQLPGTSNGWEDNTIIPILYGDIRSSKDYTSDMDLRKEDAMHALNSKGEIKPIQEVEWGNGDETPTHIIVHLSSSNAPAYSGALGSYLMVDNVKFGYR